MPELNGANHTVLYVEDEENDAFLMRMAFSRAGLPAALRVVDNGQEALDYLSGTGVFVQRDQFPVPQLVLLDLNLPILPGFEVLKWIKQQPKLIDLPVVIFSSSSREDDKQKARELGANDYLEKPQTFGSFEDLVEQLRQKFLARGERPSSF